MQFIAHKISKVKLVTVVEGDSKAPFSIATTPRQERGPSPNGESLRRRYQELFFESLLWLDLNPISLAIGEHCT